MNLVFFQNCLSPHQIPYIRECAKDERVDKVYFVMPRIDYEERSDMGWSNDKLMDEPTIEFVLKPKDDKVRELLDVGNKDVRCLFSGVRADADVFRWLNISIGFDVKRYIITEPPYTFDKPLWMHYLRFFLQDYKYVKYIDGVFAIGGSCEKFYSSISKRWKVFPFIYVTESFDVEPVSLHDDMKVLYVGSLSERKNVKVLVEAVKGLHNVQLNIVGDGEKRRELEVLSKEYGINVDFLGTMPMKDIPNEMQKNDVLVLPSLYDGWGAVVNEALTQGLYVVCSDKCGAKDLLHDKKLGITFKNNKSNDLSNVLEDITKNIDVIRLDRQYRSKWSKKNISGIAISKYLIECLGNKTINCPWK